MNKTDLSKAFEQGAKIKLVWQGCFGGGRADIDYPIADPTMNATLKSLIEKVAVMPRPRRSGFGMSYNLSVNDEYVYNCQDLDAPDEFKALIRAIEMASEMSGPQ